jgi:hypothetical protein
VALLIETKVYCFGVYRRVAMDGGLDPQRKLHAYLRVLAAWASDHPALAACTTTDGPSAPLWVEHDLVKLLGVAMGLPGDDPRVVAGARALFCAAEDMIDRVLEDATLTPLGAFNFVRPALTRILATDTGAAKVLQLQRLLGEVADLPQVHGIPTKTRANLRALAVHLPYPDWSMQ